MNNLNMKQYYDYKFKSDWKNTPEYLKFQNDYIRHLRIIFNNNNIKILKINKNHFEFSLFIKNYNTILYISIPDVRYYQNDWFDKILIRTANSENDYIGNINHYTTLNNLIETINQLTKEK